MEGCAGGTRVGAHTPPCHLIPKMASAQQIQALQSGPSLKGQQGCLVDRFAKRKNKNTKPNRVVGTSSKTGVKVSPYKRGTSCLK